MNVAGTYVACVLAWGLFGGVALAALVNDETTGLTFGILVGGWLFGYIAITDRVWGGPNSGFPLTKHMLGFAGFCGVLFGLTYLSTFVF